ncbi:MAG: RluA family pseudouridine synthase [Longimicrobiales bacterium]
MAVIASGKEARTHYQVLEKFDDCTLLQCSLETGRTHQIRVHLAARGWPIAGDAVYGAANDRIPRMALHSWRMQLRHPVTDAPLEITAPPPIDMADMVDMGDMATWCLARARHRL